jgi:hypothetical protein
LAKDRIDEVNSHNSGTAAWQLDQDAEAANDDVAADGDTDDGNPPDPAAAARAQAKERYEAMGEAQATNPDGWQPDTSAGNGDRAAHTTTEPPVRQPDPHLGAGNQDNPTPSDSRTVVPTGQQYPAVTSDEPRDRGTGGTARPQPPSPTRAPESNAPAAAPKPPPNEAQLNQDRIKANQEREIRNSTPPPPPTTPSAGSPKAMM